MHTSMSMYWRCSRACGSSMAKVSLTSFRVMSLFLLSLESELKTSEQYFFVSCKSSIQLTL